MWSLIWDGNPIMVSPPCESKFFLITVLLNLYYFHQMAANHAVIRVPSSCPPQEKHCMICGGPVTNLALISPLERFPRGHQSTSLQLHHYYIYTTSICTDIVTAPGVQVRMLVMMMMILSSRVWALLPVQPTSDTGNTEITMMMMVHFSGRMLTSRPSVTLLYNCSNVYIFIYC